jgi:beta-lactamase class D
VHGKSGSGWLNDETGAVDKSKPQGWFVGWAEKNSRRVIFVRFLIDDGASNQPAGAKARESLLIEIGPLTRHR